MLSVCLLVCSMSISLSVSVWLFVLRYWVRNTHDSQHSIFQFLLVRECFGEGLNWAGCTFIALLGQQNRFEALDFCYHIVKVHGVDSKGEVVAGVVSTFIYLF